MADVTTTRTALAQHHVTRARDIIARQRRLIAEIRACGGDSEKAEDLLSTFERSLAIFEDDLAEIVKSNGDASCGIIGADARP
jgi:ATP phosphoribosyltransferase